MADIGDYIEIAKILIIVVLVIYIYRKLQNFFHKLSITPEETHATILENYFKFHEEGEPYYIERSIFEGLTEQGFKFPKDIIPYDIEYKGIAGRERPILPFLGSL